jgi:hypothetical protein
MLQAVGWTPIQTDQCHFLSAGSPKPTKTIYFMFEMGRPAGLLCKFSTLMNWIESGIAVRPERQYILQFVSERMRLLCPGHDDYLNFHVWLGLSEFSVNSCSQCLALSLDQWNLSISSEEMPKVGAIAKRTHRCRSIIFLFFFFFSFGLFLAQSIN